MVSDEIRKFRSNIMKKNWKEKKFGIGKNHPSWKGDNATRGAFHLYLRKYYPPPKKCQLCGKKGFILEYCTFNRFDTFCWRL